MTLSPRQWDTSWYTNTAARILTAVILIPLMIGLVWWGSTGLVAVLTGGVTLLALFEFFALSQRIGLPGYRVWTAVCALGVLLQQWIATGARSSSFRQGFRVTQTPILPEVPLELIFFLFIVGIAASVFWSKRPLAQALGDIGVSAAGLVFIALPLSVLVRLDAVASIGPRLLLFTLVLIWAGDTLAYFVGRWLGHLRMAPQISPGKTWEGAAANLLGSVIVGAAFAPWLHLEARHMVVMAALANIAGQMGDLIESVYKRAAGVKDSGALLPGHGGMLDRIDALILAAPVVWYYFELVLASRL
jgi:phosphatidate cytidylyltransferase